MKLKHLIISATLAVMSATSMAQSQDLMGFDRASFGSVVLSRTQAVGTGIQLELSVGSYENEPMSNYKDTVFADIGRSVGRLDVLTDKGTFPCTAFIVSKQHILTNYHCSLGLLDDERIGATRIDASQFVAGYTQTGVDEGTKKFTVIPTPVETSAELDYAVLEVIGNPSQEFGELKLASLVPNDRAPFWIIGHPQGKGQHISREKCRASTPAVSRNTLLHTCDTLPGNSGSPVIDAGLQVVVALHHAGIANDSVNAAILMSKILENSTVLAAYKAPDEASKSQPVEPKTAANSACDALYGAAAEAKACYAYEAYINSCQDHSLAPIANGYVNEFCQPQETVKVDTVPEKTCVDDPSLCSTDQLCGQSLTFDSGKANWRKDNVSYVTEAKRRGLQCGVMAVVAMPKKTCATNIGECSADLICSRAVSKSFNKISWNTNSYNFKHVTEAKRRGLKCGVIANLANTCFENEKVCSKSEICKASTKEMNGGKIWDNHTFLSRHLAEAKRRGLTCGVTEVAVRPKTDCSKDPLACTDAALCVEAYGGNNSWETRTQYLPHVTEAKRRGLSCGVAEAVVKTDQKCSDNVEFCSEKQLCFEAVGDSNWHDNAEAREAQRRGLTCGLSTMAKMQSGFKNESILRRKQIQYSLKKLGLYSGSIDSLYGLRTESALKQYAVSKTLDLNSPQKIFSNLIREVDVPNTFASRKPAIQKEILLPAETVSETQPEEENQIKEQLGAAAEAALCIGTAVVNPWMLLLGC